MLRCAAPEQQEQRSAGLPVLPLLDHEAATVLDERRRRQW